MLRLMKKISAALILSFVLGNIAYAQSDLRFNAYITQHYKNADSLKKECGWAYLFIKMHVDDQDKVTKLEYVPRLDKDSLNSTYLKHAVDFLIGYQYPDHKKRSRDILFYFSVVPADSCKPKLLTGYADDVIHIIFAGIESEKKKDPLLEVLYNPITIFPWSIIK
jgi:hypothetical protein